MRFSIVCNLCGHISLPDSHAASTGAMREPCKYLTGTQNVWNARNSLNLILVSPRDTVCVKDVYGQTNADGCFYIYSIVKRHREDVLGRSFSKHWFGINNIENIIPWLVITIRTPDCTESMSSLLRGNNGLWDICPSTSYNGVGRVGINVICIFILITCIFVFMLLYLPAILSRNVFCPLFYRS